MKKCYLFLALSFMAACLFAQSPVKYHLTDLAKHPELLTPSLKQALFEKGTDAEGYLPPLSFEPYALTDSLYYQNWDVNTNEWLIGQSIHYTNDCEIGRATSQLTKLWNIFDGTLSMMRRSDFTYFPDRSIQTTNGFLYLDNQSQWLQVEGSNYIAPQKLGEDWYKSWDPISGAFVSGSRDVLVYDNDLKLQSNTSYDWDPSVNDWRLYDRDVYTYTNGLLTEKLREVYDGATSTWNPYSREQYQYDAAGNRTEKLEQIYNGSNWADNYKTTYSYNSLNQEIERLVIKADGNGGFTNYEKWESEYHGLNMPYYSNGYVWSGSQQDWLVSYQDSFDTDGNLTFIMAKYNYDDALGGFFFGYRVNIEYNDQGLNTSSITEQLAFGTLDTWDKYAISTIAYDAYDRFEESITKNWDSNLNDYVNHDRSYYFNTGCLFNAVEDVKTTTSNCFHANPIRPGQAINCDALPMSDAPLSLSLYALSGVKVYGQAFRPGDAFQPNRSLMSGLYLMEIKAENNSSVYRTKIIVAGE